MSSSASERPAPQLTQRPYARLSPASARQSDAKSAKDVESATDPRRTGPRPKIADDSARGMAASRTEEASGTHEMSAEGQTSGRSARPESLLKPFASLPAKRPSAERSPGEQGAPGAARPRIEQRPPGGPARARTTPPGAGTLAPPAWEERPPWEESSSGALGETTRPRAHRAVCKKHQLAKNPQGQCMRCEQESKRQDRSWLVPSVAMALAVLVGIALAALL